MEPVTTRRLTLRNYRAEDAESLMPIYSDPDVARYLLGEPWSDDDARAAVARCSARTDLDDGAVNLLAERAGRVVGAVSAWFEGGTDHTVELGWTFARDVAGQGYATEAAEALLRIVFGLDRVHRATAQMDGRNHRSARLAARLGMREEALFVSNFFYKGEWTDTRVYAILREEYLSLSR
ncbi:MAG: GNAT family N-acetyltransferase [Rhodococcus sp. (in: high G+C Gram-positive bacteria)]